MINKYKSASRLEKVFIWLSVAIVLAILVAYVRSVISALNMDPNSYNCTMDSMMKARCQDPFGSSVVWTLLFVAVLGWPVLVVWAIIGEVIFLRRIRKSSHLRKK